MQNLYSAFHDWRARLFQNLARVETQTLETLRADMQRTIQQIETEIQRRATKSARSADK